MQFIDAYTSREDLLSAIYRDGLLLDSMIDANLDPEEMTTEEIRKHVIAWIEAGDECCYCRCALPINRAGLTSRRSK